MNPISIKNDIILSHIEALPGGAKISVRGLAAELRVSEGTVYKAIKEAERRALVITRPKSGTFRTESTESESVSFSLFEISAALGAVCISGRNSLPQTVTRLLLCDGDSDQLERALSEQDARSTLCIVSNREELQILIIRKGANMLLADGCRPNDSILLKAERTGSCILCAAQNSYTLLKHLNRSLAGTPVDSEPHLASEWIQMANFLYQNDVAEDWLQFYREILHGALAFPLVDEENFLCGNIDIIEAFAASHSQRLNTLTSPELQSLVVTPDTPMTEVANRMLLTGSPIATVAKNGHAEGLLTFTDLLRYFMYSGSSCSIPDWDSVLSPVAELSNEDRLVYDVTLSQTDRPGIEVISAMLFQAAAKRHLAKRNIVDFTPLNSTTLYPDPLDSEWSFTLSSSLTELRNGILSLETELYTEEKTLAKASYLYSKKD